MDKILSVYLDPHSDHPDVVNKFMFIYKGFPLQISDADLTEFISSLPEFWHTENDKLVLFTAFSDGSYYCERQKKVYNYATKIFEQVPYRFDAANEDTVKYFVEFLVKFFEKVNIKNQNDIQQQILNEIQNYSILQSFILNTRQYILNKTDYMFLSDYKSISEEKLKQWESYRQSWRDITNQESWISGEIHKVTLPVSPEEKNQFTFSVMAELGYSNTEIHKYIDSIRNDEDFEQKMSNIVNKYCEYMLKQNIINTLSKFKLPLLDMKLNNFYSNDPDAFISDFTTDFKQFSIKVDEELKRIGTDLSVSSLISHYRSMNGSSISQEIIDILEELNTSVEDN